MSHAKTKKPYRAPELRELRGEDLRALLEQHPELAQEALAKKPPCAPA